MDIERALLSRCINTGDVETLISRGVGPQHFSDQSRPIFQTIVRHLAQYGEPPSREAVLMEHPNYRLDAPTDSVEFLLDKFVEHVQRREAEQAVIDLAERLRDPHEQATPELLFMEYTERVAQIIPNSKISRLSDAPKRIDLFRKQQELGRLPGIPIGIPELDRIILGVQGHELVVISAPSSWGKSTFLQHICLSAYLNGASKKDTPAFISLEMEGDALLRKFDTMATNFSYTLLRAMELGVGDIERWEKWGERVSNAPNDIIIIDDIAECTVERVFAEVLRWKPNAMFVDYFGIMTPRRVGGDEHVSMANMAKALKRIPRRTNIPLFTAAQTNRSGFKDGVRADNVADTIEIFRSADIMLGLQWDPDDNPEEMTVEIIKNRDGRKGSATIAWDLEHMLIGEKKKWASRSEMQAMIGAKIDQVPQPQKPNLSVINNPFAQANINPEVAAA